MSVTARPFCECLLDTAGARGDSPAVRRGEQCLSYEELFRRARSAGSELRRLGLAKGDRVLLVCEDKLDLLLCHLGVLLAGGVSVPLNPAFTPPELSYFLDDSQARFVVGSGASASVFDDLAGRADFPCDVLPPQRVLDAEGPALPAPGFELDDDAMMLYTSGTTGHPKGAVHTQGSLTAAVSSLADRWRFVPEDRLLNCLPLFHIHGLSFACHVALLTGCEILITDRFHPRRTLDRIGDATVFYGVPPFYYSFLGRPEFPEKARAWDKLRLVTCGSAPIRPEVLPELDAILQRPLINRYGMTETHVITSLPVGGPIKQGSVGLPLLGIEMEVRGETGEKADVDEVGQVWVRGPNLFDRYWCKPEATRGAFDANGWFCTGDLGQLDETGFLTLRGREKDLIIVSGFNVYPPVVERVLNSCPGVRESAVVGVPDDRRGERVVAAVVKEDSALDEVAVRGHCAEHLIGYQRPSRIVFVESLPRNTMGKVLKRELRDSLA